METNRPQLEIYPTAQPPMRLAVCERPRNRARSFGVAALSDVEALAMVFQGNGEEPEKAIEQARAVVVRFGSLGASLGRTAADFMATGLSEALAFRLVATLEVSRRVIGQQIGEAPLLDQPGRIAQFMAAAAAGLEVEKFWVL